MSLTSVYQSFLASPNATFLASDAAFNFVPTLVTVTGPDNIEKHFTREQKLYQKKREEILHSIESDNALCLEVGTTIKFIAGGGSYLPGLDDNFLTERTVSLPMVHVVQFSDDMKIQQSRVYWDQGSLLKLVEVIGSRAKNWPVKDGAEHIRIIRKSAASAPVSSNTPIKQNFPFRQKSVPNAMRDPMASLELFAPRNIDEEDAEAEPVRAPRGTARPPPREYGELFVAAQEDDPRERSESPSKSRNRAKTGAGKNYHDPRLFSSESEQKVNQSPQKPIVDKRYNHFEFSDGHDQPSPDPAPVRPRTKHQSQWDFEDFITPAKARNKTHPQEQRSFGWSDNEDEVISENEKTPPKPRRDAETHFEFKDDGNPPVGKVHGPPRGAGSMNMNSVLYKNNLYDDKGLPGTPKNDTGITNVKDRSKDFDAHWQMTEGTPRVREGNENDRRAALQRPLSTVVDNDSRKKDFNTQFIIKDDSPGLMEKSESDRNREMEARPSQENHGGVPRRGANQVSWSLTGLDEPQSAKKVYRTAGDGMGSRSGSRGWAIGDNGADGESGEAHKAAAKRKVGKSDDWQF